MRTYKVTNVAPYYYWYWGDEGNPLTTSVVYGYAPTGGFTYISASSLPSATNNIPVTVRTYNNEYWNIDTSYTTFNTP